MKKSITTLQTAKPVLRLAGLSLLEKRRPVAEIARQVDKRPLKELRSQVADALKQILARAHTGDKDALELYFFITRETVKAFDYLAMHELERTRRVTELSPDLPVLLSLNPQDIEAAKERMRLLNVGTKAIRQTRPGQRTDRRNFWTRLAIHALDACLRSFQSVPKIDFTGAKQRKGVRKLWGIAEHGIEHTFPNGQRIVIEDWQMECVKLAGKITPDNFNQWRSVVKICVLDFWKRSSDDYNKALNEVGNRGKFESYRRHLAMNRTLQAFQNQFLPR